jgi:acylphosphatase
VRRRVLVAGRVQGVFFRQSLVDEAEARGVRGWVRNLLDGRVEAVLEGPEEAVGAVVAWCHEGPPVARVEAVESSEEPARGEPAGFRVLPTARASDMWGP